MNNLERLKTMSKNEMANFLYALLRSSCSYPKDYDCRKCSAKSLCYRESKYSIAKWLESEVENE